MVVDADAKPQDTEYSVDVESAGDSCTKRVESLIHPHMLQEFYPATALNPWICLLGAWKDFQTYSPKMGGFSW